MKSENILLVFAFVAMVLSVLTMGVVYYSVVYSKPSYFTGLVSSDPNATVNLTIVSNAAINFTVNSIEFGSGYVETGKLQATLRTDGQNNSNGTWTNVTRGFVLENIGSTNLTLWLLNTKNASDFIGTGATYQLNVTNNETGSCANRSGFDLGQWYDANKTNSGAGAEGTYICSNLSYVDSGDAVRIDLKITIPYTSPPGYLVDTVSAVAYPT